MTRTRSILGALLLSALAVCVFGAASASAMTLHECKEVGAKGTGIHYSDAKCSVESAEGKFETEPLPANTNIEVENTLTPTTAGNSVTPKETAGTHIVLHTILGGVEVQITCKGASSPGAVVKDNAGPPMSVTGTGKAKYTECEIVGGEKAAANCQVPATLETVELSMTTEGMNLVFKPKEGTAFITISFTSKAGKTCPAGVAGEKQVQGTARAVVVSPTAIEFTNTPETEITFGGQKAFLTAVTHLRTKGTTGETGTVALETNATTDNK